MAYAQWVIIILRNRSSENIKVKNVTLSWGKYHADDDKDAEIEKSAIEGKVIPGGTSFRINSCGRENASSGTEGSFEIYSDQSNTFIRKVYWECPWGTKRNTFTVSGQNEDWMVEDRGANRDSGAIGTVTITLVKL